MEQEVQEAQQTPKDDKKTNVGVPYPIETVKESLAVIDGIVSTFGTGAIITKEDISKATNKKVNTLVMSFSTYQQYGILENVHGKGFKTSELYKKYKDKIFPQHEHEAMVEMFARPRLYAKILANLNNTYLPTEEKFRTVLQAEPYNVVPGSTDRAARVFYSNIRDLHLLVNHSLRYSVVPQVTPPQGNVKEIPPLQTPAAAPQDNTDDSLFELPIPLPGKRKAYLKYPIDTLTARDIGVITKALAFIASSIGEDGNEDETKKE